MTIAVVALACCVTEGRADVPDWVPPKYVKYFHRYVDDRPAWQRALGSLNVSVGETGRSFALVAAVSRYPRISGRAADLWPARLDAEKMVAYLQREPESFNEIVVLLDEDVTSETLGYFLTQYFPRRLAETPRSRFLFAYSGHGMTADNGRGYLLTSEAASLDDPFTGTIAMTTLRAQFQEIVDRGHQVLALINACYGVDFHRLSLAFGEGAPPLPTREGAHAITAGGTGELTWHDPTFGLGDGPKGSIFFEALFAALDGRADKLPADGIVSVGELETFLRATISSFTDDRQNPIGADLRPEHSPGGFFFLDRNRQIENDNAAQLEGIWWSGLSFGEAGEQATDGSAGGAQSLASPSTLGSSLAGHWSFDELGTTAPDISGNGNHGIASGTKWQPSGYLNGAIEFDGSSGSVNAGSPSSLDDLAPLSVSVWIYPRSAGEDDDGWIVAKAEGTSYPTDGWVLSLAGDTLGVKFTADHEVSHLEHISAPRVVTYNAWNHVVATWDGTTRTGASRIFVNGADVSANGGAPGEGKRYSDADVDLIIGNSPGRQHAFDGYIDEVRLYERLLSESDVDDLYALHAPRAPSARQQSPQ